MTYELKSKKLTELMIAIIENKEETVKELLNKKAKISAKDDDGNTALHHATTFNDCVFLKLILGKKKSLETKNNNGETVLHCAAKNGNVKAVEELINAGSKVDSIDINGNSPLHRAAASPNNSDVINALLDNNADINFKNKSNTTPLFLAIVLGDVENMEAILKRKPDLSYNNNGETYLGTAVLSEDKAVIQVILEYGIKANVVNDDKKTFLHEALRFFTKKEVLAILISWTENLNYEDGDGNNYIHHAAMSNNTEGIDVLFRNGVDICHKNKKGMTPFNIAVENKESVTANYIEKLWKLMESDDSEKMKKDVCETFYKGATPLLVSICVDDKKTVKTLLDRGADVNQMNFVKMTPIHFATVMKNEEIVKMILERKPDLELKNYEDNTVLQTAIRGRNTNIIKMLLDAKANMEVKDKDGNTPLIRACVDKQSVIIDMLIEAGADINSSVTI